MKIDYTFLTGGFSLYLNVANAWFKLYMYVADCRISPTGQKFLIVA